MLSEEEGLPYLSNVAVVGLLPRQAQRVAAAFPQSGLKFIPRDREREVSTITAQMDRIVVMTKFISHHTWREVPREKITPVNGGITELKAKLRSLVRKAHKPKPNQMLEQSSLRPQESVPVASTADYTQIKTAAPGSVLRFRRPDDVPLTVFEKQTSAARSYYKRAHGIETEQQTTDDGIEVTVLGTRDSAPSIARKSATTEANQAFWTEAYLRMLTALPGIDPQELARRADEAVAAFQQRFG